MNRRTFLGTSAFAAAPFILTRPSLFAQEVADLGGKRVGLIGTGWYGKCDLFRLLQVSPAEVVSLCDVDQLMLKDAGDQVSQRQQSRKVPRLYGDYREMLAEKDLDIVLIDTPDHWHALQMIEAVKAGADVYVQKPTGVDVIESEAMLAAARKYGRVVQVGFQRRSTLHLIEAVNDIIKAGRLGKVSHVDIFCYYKMRAKGNPPVIAPPPTLDFGMWTGPAPLIPFTEMIHPRKWRAFMEYGNGIVGDMCVHMLDMVRWMLDLGGPRTISSHGGIFVDKAGRANISDTQTATFGYENLNIVWNHRTWGDPPDPEYPWGAVLYGEKGTLKASVMRYDFIPNDGSKPIRRDVMMELEKYPEDQKEKDLEKHVAPAIRSHMLDFLKHIENRGKPVADIEEGHISSVSCVLANQAMQLGRTLAWDAQGGFVKADDEANRLLRRPYRAPWLHPEPGGV